MRVEGEFDAAFLNAGIGIGHPDVAELPDDELPTESCARTSSASSTASRELRPPTDAERRLDRRTASLAGLTGMAFDPLYTATKHAVVGFVRGAAAGLAGHGIRINALCPGFTDTPIVEDELREALPAPLMRAVVRRRGRADA